MKGCEEMVVNKGFSFSNIVGTYAIKEMPADHKLNSTNKIITALYPGNLKKLYSQNSYEEGSIAYEFHAIDTNDIEQIIQFCNQYGLLFSNRLLANQTNNYIFMKTYKSIFSEAVPNFTPDEVNLDMFIDEVITMHRLIGLKAALDTNDPVELINCLLPLLLCYTYKTPEPGTTETECFNNLFYKYLSSYYLIDQPCLFKLKDVYLPELNHLLDDLTKFVYEHKTNRWLQLPLKLEEYKYMNNCTWQNYHDIMINLLKVVSISSNDSLSELYYSEQISTDLLNSCGITDLMLQQAAVTCLADHFNAQTMLITPELRFENDQLTSDWKITSLLEAMYMELSISFAPNTQVKKCANPTCNSFFDVGIGNSRKIYCSNRCALLMAKRKQRERDKHKHD